MRQPPYQQQTNAIAEKTLEHISQTQDKLEQLEHAVLGDSPLKMPLNLTDFGVLGWLNLMYRQQDPLAPKKPQSSHYLHHPPQPENAGFVLENDEFVATLDSANPACQIPIVVSLYAYVSSRMPQTAKPIGKNMRILADPAPPTAAHQDNIHTLSR
jgi:hypothetical protein